MKPSLISRDFENYVERVLSTEWMGKRVNGAVWGTTPHGQQFALVTSQFRGYAIRLIVDEEHRDLELAHVSYNVQNANIVLKKSFHDFISATQYVIAARKALINGTFDDTVRVRIRRLPRDVFFNPDKYLKPGDHLQRDLDFKLRHHEGIYLGENRVAFLHDSTNLSDGDCQVRMIIDSFQVFAENSSKEVHVLVHCIRRRTRRDICNLARFRCDYKTNPRHLLSLCVIGEEWLSDKWYVPDPDTNVYAWHRLPLTLAVAQSRKPKTDAALKKVKKETIRSGDLDVLLLVFTGVAAICFRKWKNYKISIGKLSSKK